jgi:MraZ protein
VEELFGRDEGKLNAQGRLSIPSKHRKVLPEQLVVAKSPDKSNPGLVGYPKEGYSQWFKEVLESKGGSQANSLEQFKLRDEFYGETEVVDFDGNGRILIPQFLRDYAHITTNVVISGMGSSLLIRTPEVYEESRKAFAETQVFDEPTLAPAP